MSVLVGSFVIDDSYFLPINVMATIEERHYHHDADTGSSATLMAVLLLAAVVIVGFLLYATSTFPFAGRGAVQSDVDVDLPAQTDMTPDVNVDEVNVNPNY